MLIGMNYLDGFTRIQYEAIKDLSSFLFDNKIGKVYVSKMAYFHGKMYSFDKEGFNTVYPGGVLYGEVRYNLKQIPLDFGLSASAQIFSISEEENLFAISALKDSLLFSTLQVFLFSSFF